jgi:hypothetical protein
MAKNYNKIKDLREKNNKNTVDILRLAFKFFPTEAKKLLVKVNEGDNKISKLLEELTLENYNQILDNLEELRRKNNVHWIELMKLADHGNSAEYKKYQQIQQTLNEDLDAC